MEEGFARYIENAIRRRLGVGENHLGGEPPFTRITFYEGGSKLINTLVRHNPKLLNDLEKLFWKICELSK